MRVSIYDVERGFCAFVRTPNNKVVVVDAGHAFNGWTPSAQLAREGFRRIDRLVISSCNRDRVDDLAALLAFDPREYVANITVPAEELMSPESPGAARTSDAAAVGAVVEGLREGPIAPPTDWGGVELVHFFNPYKRDFGPVDLAELSVVTFAHFQDAHVIFPGELCRAGWLRLLQKPNFVAQLQRVNVFVAARQGRPEGCCDEVFAHCRPSVVVMSDSGAIAEAKRTAEWYAERASGLLVDGRQRRVLSTHRDRAIHLSHKRGFGSWLWTEMPDDAAAVA